MGSIISAPIPDEIYPVESYVSTNPRKDNVHSLGSTRFMKVARVDKYKQPKVVKVFIINDQKLDLHPFESDVVEIKSKLEGAPNCLPFFTVNNCTKYLLLSRPYIKDSLYERLMARPFLIEIEKKWVSYQLIKVLKQLRDSEVCHGDIKSQNVLVSSSLWVHLADFASFKPTRLPTDNPSCFHFFFDTSRRKSCYIAPERFQNNIDMSYESLFNQPLLHYMDIFSIGCVIMELYSEGRYLFNLAQLLEYKISDQKTIEHNENFNRVVHLLPESMKRLVVCMLSKDPVTRLKYTDYLEEAFPPIFDDFYRFFQNLAPKSLTAISTTLSPSTTMLKESLDSTYDFDYILSMSLFNNDSFIEDEYSSISPWNMLTRTLEGSNDNSVVLLITFINSKMRVIRNINAKIGCLKLYKKLAKLSSPSLIIDRILPYVVYFFHDLNDSVKEEAYLVMCHILSCIDIVPQSEFRIFPDYIFGKIDHLINDNSSLVKMAIAKNLGLIAMTALRFLQTSDPAIPDADISEHDDEDENSQDKIPIKPKPKPEAIFRKEKKYLQKFIFEKFITLCDSPSARPCLIAKENLIYFCEFFEKHDITDIFGHMTRFLNYVENWKLRVYFFDASSTLIISSGSQITKFLEVLIIDTGFKNSDEFVIYSAMKCFESLLKESQIEKDAIIEIFKHASPFLIHPNAWLRAAVVRILGLLETKFSDVDMFSLISPIIEPFLKNVIYKFNNPTVVTKNLIDHIPRSIWKILIHSESCIELLDSLIKARSLHTVMNNSTNINNVSPSTLRLYEKLKTNGLDKEMENKLIYFNKILPVISDYKQNEDKNHLKYVPTINNVDLSSIPNLTRCKLDLISGVNQTSIHSPDVKVKVNDNVNIKSLNLDISSKSGRYTNIHTGAVEYFSSQTAYQQSLKNLLEYEIKRFKENSNFYSEKNSLYTGTMVETEAYNMKVPPRLTLLSNIYEHHNTINKLAVHKNGNTFVSGSCDGSVKLWSVESFKNLQNWTVKSKFTKRLDNATINSVQFVTNNNCTVAVASSDGLLQIIDPESKDPTRNIKYDYEKQGSITEMYGSNNIIYAVTKQSYINIFDLRISNFGGSSDSVWEDSSNTLLTTLAVDPLNENWMVTTGPSRPTSINVWDLRFRIKVINHNSNDKYKQYFKIWPYVRSGECKEFWASDMDLFKCDLYSLYKIDPDGDRNYKMRVFDQVTVSSRSNEQATERISKVTKFNAVVNAMAVCPITGHIFTGDLSGAIRYWDVENNNRCNYLCGPLKKYLDNDLYNITYDVKHTTLDNNPCRITKEVWNEKRQQMSKEDRFKTTKVNFGHTSSISDLLAIPSSLLISGDQSGVIKVWKINVE
uniref:non-specific serine/threonine protein kinase n=1 Tax=Parastrongyloides trichosuri TaxID=131310 RepID=A0A0N4ZFB3_PARTI